jgi:4-amino-4-deoxy-L-arabinose transferase-like glycosyltransferase
MLITIVGLITYKCFQIQISLGPIWDTYDLLSDAALFSGQNIGYYDLVRPPFIPFITSLFFRIYGLSTWPIMLIDGLIFILGSVGLYFFLKSRFDNLTSFLGALLFATFPIVLTFVCSGLTDISSVCFSIWALFFAFLAIKDSRFFYLSFPIAMIAFLTRFSAALIIFPLFFFILINKDEINNKKDILIGIFISFLLLIPVFWLFYLNFGNPLYTFFNFFSSTSPSVSNMSNLLYAYNPDFLYFLKSIPSLIGPQAMGVVLVIILGFFIYPFRRLIIKKDLNGKNETKKSKYLQAFFKNEVKIKLSFLFISLLIFILTIQRIHYLFSVIIFCAFLYVLYLLLDDFNFKNMDLDFLFLTWFMVFFIFHSVYVVKDYRYFIDMAPPIAYFLMRGFKLTTFQLGIKIKNINITHYLFSGFLIFLIIFSTYNYLPSIEETNNYLKQLNEDNINISEYLMNYDPEYRSKILYSDIWPYSGWYLKKNISKMPQFINNQVIYTGSNDHNLTNQDIMAYNHELDVNQADYYISRINGLTLQNYIPLKQFGTLILYQRIK